MAKRGTQITIAMLIAAGVAIPAASFASGGSGGGGGGTSGRSTLPPATVVTDPVVSIDPTSIPADTTTSALAPLDTTSIVADTTTVLPDTTPSMPLDTTTVPPDTTPSMPLDTTTMPPAPADTTTTAAPTPPPVTPAPTPAPAPAPTPAPVVKADSLKVMKAYTNATATTAGQMLIKAASSNPRARLFAYRPDGTLIGEVVNGGGSRYGGTVMPIQMYDPASVTIRSSMGGSITVPTTAFKI